MSRPAHPTLPGDLAVTDERFGDADETWPVLGERRVYSHPFLSIDLDTVQAPDDASFERVYVRHQGGVGIVALDDEDRVLLLAQYRHPVRRRLAELPAGVLDRPGEDPLTTAVRELAEEADLTATTWSRLLQLYSTPGSSDEVWHIYLARGLAATPQEDRFAREHEEAHMDRVWVPLDEAVRSVLAGRITNAMAVSALLAVWTQHAP